MEDGTSAVSRRAPKRSRRVLLADPATDAPDSRTKKARDLAPPFLPPVETPSAPARAAAIPRAPDELVVVCTGTGGDSSALRKLAPSARARAIQDLVGDIAELRRLRSGALVFVAHSSEQVNILLRQSTFCGLPVVMRPPKSRNSGRYGVISGIELSVDTDALRSALLSAGATEYSRLQRRSSDGSLQETTSIRVAFANELPEFFFFNFERLRVRPFVHRPLQCFHCQRYGHGAAHCRSEARCGRCSGPHVTKDCPGEIERCAVCGNAHPAWSRSCAFNVRARQVEHLRANEGLSYAAAVRRVPPVPPTVRRPPTTSVACQTDEVIATPPPPVKDAETNTVAFPVPDKVPHTSTLLLRSSAPDSPVMFLLQNEDTIPFLEHCITKLAPRIKKPHLTQDLAESIVDSFIEANSPA